MKRRPPRSTRTDTPFPYTLSSDLLPVIAGLEPLASAMSGGTRVTLFAITEPGLFQLTVAGSGAYDLELGIAGDVNADGKVDGADGAAVAAALAGSDISGDGLVDAVDRQLVEIGRAHV